MVPGSGVPIVWSTRSIPCRCQPPYRRCWQRAWIGCSRRTNACSRLRRSLVREVPWPLLQAIADVPEEALYCSLAQLQAAEFLYETSLFPEHAYTFKHALTHEVAYGSLLQERRRVLHARIVDSWRPWRGIGWTTRW